MASLWPKPSEEKRRSRAEEKNTLCSVFWKTEAAREPRAEQRDLKLLGWELNQQIQITFFLKRKIETFAANSVTLNKGFTSLRYTSYNGCDQFSLLPRCHFNKQDPIRRLVSHVQIEMTGDFFFSIASLSLHKQLMHWCGEQ